MAVEIPSLNLLLLAAGQSSRMGYPKFLLPFPDKRQSYAHAVEVLDAAVPRAKGTYMLLRDRTQLELLRDTANSNLRFLFTSDSGQTAATSLAFTFSAAIHHDPNSHWLMMPCDYPLLTPRELKRLVAEYHPPVTCLKDGLGELHPLVSLWSPDALVCAGSKGAEDCRQLSRIIQDLGGTGVRPLYDFSLFNVNTSEDWQEAMALMVGKG